jgi:hypothetical protein
LTPCQAGGDAEITLLRIGIIENLGVEQMRKNGRLAPKERVPHALSSVAAVQPPPPRVARERTLKDDEAHHAAE